MILTFRNITILIEELLDRRSKEILFYLSTAATINYNNFEDISRGRRKRIAITNNIFRCIITINKNILGVCKQYDFILSDTFMYNEAL